MFEQIQTKLNKLLSVIIISKNDYKNLLLTYNSFNFSADFRQNVQLLLIDGGSTEETLSFIKSYSANFDKIISEPDEGIYDAMNKGINLATSDWTIFMNAGDNFADQDVLEKIMEHLNSETDVLYGDCLLKYPGFNLLKKAGQLSDLWKGMITTHQSFIIKTSLLKENKFNLNYKLGADFDQAYKIYKQRKRFKYIPISIAEVDTSGVSNTKIFRTRIEHYKSLRKNERLSLFMHLYYIFNFVYLDIIILTRLLFPKKLYYSIIRAINRRNLV